MTREACAPVARAALVAVALALALASCAQSPPPGVVRIDAAERRFVAASGDAPPASLRRLPDAWSPGERAKFRRARYRAELRLVTAPEERWAIYLPRAEVDAAVLLNGVPLGAGEGALAARMRHRPQLFVVSPGMLHAGANEVEIVLAALPSAPAVLAPFQVGPEAALRLPHARRTFLQVTLVVASVGAALWFAVVLWLLYAGRGRGSSYRWLLLAIALWIVHASDVWVREPVLPAAAWDATVRGAFLASVWALMLAFHRALAEARPRLEAASLVAVVGSTALMVAAPASRIPILLWGTALCGLAAYLVVFVARGEPRQEWVLNRRHAIGGAAALAIELHDVTSLLVGAPLLGVWLLPYAGGIATLLAIVFVSEHLVRSAVSSRSLQRDLDGRVTQAEAELESRYAALRQLEAHVAVQRERDRLARDLHAGVGATLQSALAALDGDAWDHAPRIGDRLRDALDDLRILMDSLDPAGGLLDLLARLRSRLAPRLERRGVALAWRVQDVPPMDGFGSEQALSVLRILHVLLDALARAPQPCVVSVRTGTTNRDGRAGIFVAFEEGVTSGLPPVSAATWAALQDRARSLGGALDLVPKMGGATLRLWLPAERAPGRGP